MSGRAGHPLEFCLKPREQRLQHLHPRPALVLRLDQRPGRGRGAGPIDHLADGIVIQVPFLAIAPVLVRDLILLVLGVGGR